MQGGALLLKVSTALQVLSKQCYLHNIYYIYDICYIYYPTIYIVSTTFAIYMISTHYLRSLPAPVLSWVSCEVTATITSLGTTAATTTDTMATATTTHRCCQDSDEGDDGMVTLSMQTPRHHHNHQESNHHGAVREEENCFVQEQYRSLLVHVSSHTTYVSIYLSFYLYICYLLSTHCNYQSIFLHLHTINFIRVLACTTAALQPREVSK